MQRGKYILVVFCHQIWSLNSNLKDSRNVWHSPPGRPNTKRGLSGSHIFRYLLPPPSFHCLVPSLIFLSTKNFTRRNLADDQYKNDIVCIGKLKKIKYFYDFLLNLFFLSPHFYINI